MYTKTIFVYSKQERESFHKRGIWIDKNGYQLPVFQMSRDRLGGLVKTLGTWAMDEDDPILFIKHLHIYPHVLSRIYQTNLQGSYASMFKLAAQIDFAVG